MLTAALVTKLIRQILVDYNTFPQSESDSPLKIARYRNAPEAGKTFNDKAILSRDASMRKKAVGEIPSYKVPERRIEVKTLDEVFKPLVATALTQVQTVGTAVQSGRGELGLLQKPIEQSEFLVQLYTAFKQLANSKVSYVVDGTNTSTDAFTGLFITGESSDGEIIIAQTLLVQT